MRFSSTRSSDEAGEKAPRALISRAGARLARRCPGAVILDSPEPAKQKPRPSARGFVSDGRTAPAMGIGSRPLGGSRSVLGWIMHNNGVACNKILEVADRPHQHVVVFARSKVQRATCCPPVRARHVVGPQDVAVLMQHAVDRVAPGSLDETCVALVELRAYLPRPPMRPVPPASQACGTPRR